MKKRIDRDEWWPVWTFEHDGQYEVEVPDEFVPRFEAALAEFNEVQDILRHFAERRKDALTDGSNT